MAFIESLNVLQTFYMNNSNDGHEYWNWCIFCCKKVVIFIDVYQFIQNIFRKGGWSETKMYELNTLPDYYLNGQAENTNRSMHLISL